MQNLTARQEQAQNRAADYAHGFTFGTPAKAGANWKNPAPARRRPVVARAGFIASTLRALGL